jgi:hypothetical protein
LPAAALAQDASRNSWLVATRSLALRPDPLGVAQDDVGARRQLVDEQHHLVDQRGRERLHALDRGAVGELVEHLDQLGMLDREQPRPLAHLGVSSSSRHGGAHRPCSAISRLRWSATLK